MGTKAQEAASGCFAKAMTDEPMFVLLARDKSAPDLVRKWARDRENDWSPPLRYAGDPEPEHPDADQIAEARYCAARMEVWRYENAGKWRNQEEPE